MSNVLQNYLKGFKLKRMIVEPKIAQPVEPDKEPIDPQLNQLMGEKNLLSSKTVVQSVEVEPQPVEVWSRGDRAPTVTCQALKTND